MFRFHVSALIFALTLSACAVGPTGRQQLMLVDPQQIDAMGAQAFTELKRREPIATNPRTNAYVRCVAREVISEIGNPAGWEILVFDDGEENAFALPGGKIGVYTGLLRVTGSQDELAAIIAHEVAHLLSRHANERASQQFATQGLLTGVGALAGDSGSTSSQALLQALGLGAQVGILLPYSRLHEQEADVLGMDLMARAGFDPRAAITLWQGMERRSRGQPLEFLSTHPSHGTRIADLQARLPAAMQIYETARARGRRPACG